MFFMSALLLLIGLLVDSWRNGLHLEFLNQVHLNVIERDHTHLPSPKIIMTIMLLGGVLLAVAFYLFDNIYIRFASDTWLIPATFFINVCALGILAELKWKGARDYAFGFTVCTAMVFMLAVILEHRSFSGLSIASVLLVLTLCIFASQRILFHAWTHKVRLLAFVTSSLWMIVFFMYA